MSHPNPQHDKENELPEDVTDAELGFDENSEERAAELKAIEKEDSATEQYLEDQRL